MPLSTLLAAARTRRATAGRIRAVPGRRRGVPRPSTITTTSRPERANLPALREVWTPERAHRGHDADVDAVAATVTAADTLVIMFTSGSSGPPKGVIHSHGNALRAVQSGLAARCIDADTRLYLPMPFFWVGGFGSGILSALLAGATLVTEQIPQPETTLRAARARAGDAVSRLARPGGSPCPPVEVDRRRPVRTAAGQPRGAAASRSAAGAGCAGQAVRHDRGVRTVLRLPRRHRHARIGLGVLRQAVRRHRGPHRRHRHRRTRARRERSA